MTTYLTEDEAKRDVLCRPMSMAEVLKRTGRSQRTIERWTTQGLLTRYEVEHPREIVYLERQVLEVDRAKRLAAHQGRPGPRKATGVDKNA